MKTHNTFLAWASASIASAVVLVGAAVAHVEPFWILLTGVAVPSLVFVMRRFPAVFIPLLIFIPALKTRPAAGFSPADPTFIAMALLYGAVVLNVFLVLSGANESSLKQRFAGQGRSVAAFCLFAAVVAFSFLYSPVHAYGLDKLGRFVAISAMLFFAPLVLLRDRRDFRHFVGATLALGLLVGAKVLVGIVRPAFMAAAKYTSQGMPEQDVTRIGPGQLVGITLLLLIFCHLLKGRINRLAITFSIPFLVAALVAATARGPIVSFVLVLGISVVVARIRAQLMASKAMALGVVALVVFTFAISLVWIQGTVARTKFETKKQELVQLLSGSSAPSYTAGKRLDFYANALIAISKRPVAGWGLGGWSAYYNHQDFRSYPHNMFMEVGTEQGLLGLAALGFFFSTMILPLRTIWREEREFIFLLPILAFAFCVAMFSGDLNDNHALWLWCGAALAASRMLMTSRMHQTTRVITLIHSLYPVRSDPGF